MALHLGISNTNSHSTDARRLFRPFFLTPVGSKSLPSKRYYDIFTWLVTQLAFSFTTAPFILLSLDASMKAWARVYFYAIIGVTICSLLLLTHGKAYLQRKVKARSTKPGAVRPGVSRGKSQESLKGETLGVPSDPGREFDDMVDEVFEEVRKRKGSNVPADGMELRKRIESTLREKMGGQKGQ